MQVDLIGSCPARSGEIKLISKRLKCNVKAVLCIFYLQVTFTIESIMKFINSQFVLKSCKDKNTRLQLRGEL